MRVISSVVLCLALSAGAAGASANPGLAHEDDINSGLFVVAVAEKIQRECDSIAPRFFAARSYLVRLKDMAAERGYSEREIDSYVNDDAEKAKMRKRRNEYFYARGASNHDPDSLCVLGHAEIDRQSQIGILLRAK